MSVLKALCKSGWKPKKPVNPQPYVLVSPLTRLLLSLWAFCSIYIYYSWKSCWKNNIQTCSGIYYFINLLQVGLKKKAQKILCHWVYVFTVVPYSCICILGWAHQAGVISDTIVFYGSMTWPSANVSHWHTHEKQEDEKMDRKAGHEAASQCGIQCIHPESCVSVCVWMSLLLGPW